MSIRQKWREKRFRELASGSVDALPNKKDQDQIELEKALQHRHENRVRDIKKLIPVILGAILGGYFSRTLLTSVVSGNTATVIVIASLVVSFVLMWWITVRTYMPPGVDYTVTGHVDPKDIHSMITIQDVHVPKDLITNVHQDAPNFPIMRDFGPSNLCDSFEWDPLTGEINMTPAWGANSEYEFVTSHEVYHNTKEIAKVQARTINNYDSYMDLEIEIRSYDKAVEKLDQISASLFEPADARKIMTELRSQIEKDKADLRVRIYGKQTERNEGPINSEAENNDGQ